MYYLSNNAPARPCYNQRMDETNAVDSDDAGVTGERVEVKPSPDGAGANVGGAIVMGDEARDGQDTTQKQVIYTETGQAKASIVPSHGNGRISPYSTPERAREMAAKRWATARRYAAAEVVRRVGAVAEPGDVAVIEAVPVGQQWAAAYGVLAGVQAERAYMDADAQSFRNVRQALGADVGAPDRTAVQAQAQPGNDTDAADLAAILAAYRAWRDRSG